MSEPLVCTAVCRGGAPDLVVWCAGPSSIQLLLYSSSEAQQRGRAWKSMRTKHRGCNAAYGGHAEAEAEVEVEVGRLIWCAGPSSTWGLVT
jgi:hypothetical protein